MEFEEACSEVNYILEHMNPSDIIKIPETVREFFKTNKSLTYKVKLDASQDLKDQNLKDETRAFIQILNAKYFAPPEKRAEFIAMLNEKEVELKEENYIHEEKKIEETPFETKELVIYKENRLIRWIKNLLNIFRRK